MHPSSCTVKKRCIDNSTLLMERVKKFVQSFNSESLSFLCYTNSLCILVLSIFFVFFCLYYTIHRDATKRRVFTRCTLSFRPKFERVPLYKLAKTTDPYIILHLCGVSLINAHDRYNVFTNMWMCVCVSVLDQNPKDAKPFVQPKCAILAFLRRGANIATG